MKKFYIAIFLFFPVLLSAQTLEGSWILTQRNGSPVQDTQAVRIYQDGYFSEAAKNTTNNEFLWAKGGEFQTGDYRELIDFDTREPALVGDTLDSKLSFVSADQIRINHGTEEEVWQRISNSVDDLSGNWVITGRQRNGEMNTMTPGDRRTIKILGGERFQWVAFNSATGEFFGSGAGTYTAKNGKYEEMIDTFSRDKNRVGARLEFHYEVKDGQWHHSGKSSKGEDMYEIWSPYAEAYAK